MYKRFLYILSCLVLLPSCVTGGDEILMRLKELQTKENWKIIYSWGGDSLYDFSFNGKHKKIYSKKDYIIDYPSFSKDAKNIFFCIRKIGEEDNDIAIINSDGTGFRNLLSFKKAKGASLSPDGKKIVFWGDYNEKIKSKNMYLFEIEENKLTLLQQDATYAETAFPPSWSPDSRQLVYSSLEGHVTIIDIYDSKIRKLIAGDAPSWSPDGKTIIFREGISYFRTLPDKKTTEYYVEGYKYYAIEPNGGDKKFLFDGKSRFWEAGGNAYAPVVWSPDSKYFLFYKPYDSLVKGPNNARIYIMDFEKNNIYFVKKLSEIPRFSWGSLK